MKSYLALLILAVIIALPAQAQKVADVEIDVVPRPVDFGSGPGVPASASLRATEQIVAAPSAVVPSGAGANMGGLFGPPEPWPLIAIHAVLLRDGRVMSYGSDGLGQQGAEFVYDVWDRNAAIPAHLLLPNTTATDFFCGAQSALLGSGNVLLAGGDQTIGGVRNYSNDRTTIFDVQNNGLNGSRPPMMYRRWYGSLIPLGNGEKLLLGGREDRGYPVVTPEAYNEVQGWRTLSGATSDTAFGIDQSHWYYPRAYQLADGSGDVLVLAHVGDMYRLNPAGIGTISKLVTTAPIGDYRLPMVMFAPGRIFSVRKHQKAIVIDLNGAEPIVTETSYVGRLRFWSNATVLADGKVLVSGGSGIANQLLDVAYPVQIWDPSTGAWTTGASATKPRLYHSSALLLPDATVLTAGGGAPGPIKQLNAEIYYPPYLYDAAGSPAPRPLLLAAPELLSISANREFAIAVESGNLISKVTLIHTGSVTHSTDVEQRFEQLAFVQEGQTLRIQTPANRDYTVPGYYMLFVFNEYGVPSIAKIIKMTS